jgi:citrate lyase subunit beta / citryl-CoA lyase
MQVSDASFRPRRSALFLPASNARALAKARGAPTDVVILDLEDSIPPQDKAAARAAAVSAVREGGFGGRELVVRCNPLSTPWGADDLKALARSPLDGVLIPKAEGAAGLRAHADLLGGVPLWAMVESCAAVLRIDALAGAGPWLKALVLGPNDLAKEMRCTPGPDRAPLQGAMAAVVMAARAHGLAAFDGVWNAIDDLEGLERECLQAAAFGFDGKTLIHPRHLEICNRAFSPGASATAWAEKVVAAFAEPENQAAAVIRLDGRMVERLHLEDARRVLRLAGIDSPSAPSD